VKEASEENLKYLKKKKTKLQVHDSGVGSCQRDNGTCGIVVSSLVFNCSIKYLN